MGRRIDLPKTPSGEPEQQLQQLYSYLYQMAEALNNNLAEIGGSDLTDRERAEIREVIGTGDANEDRTETETLKSLIIKTASFVQSSLNEYRTKLLGEYVAEGKFGKYVRRTGLDVDVTPSGITQNYTLQEIVQGLKTYEVNAKNYIKTGYLRTESSLPVYGVAIGKDVVTFSEDGTETYNDGNKVAELTADELSFWQNQQKVASYKGNRISFFYNGAEAFYISAGKIYCVNDFELSTGKKMTIKSGGTLKVESGGNIDINATGNLKLNGADVEIKSGSTFAVDSQNLKVSTNGYLLSEANTDVLGEKMAVSIGPSLQQYPFKANILARHESYQDGGNTYRFCRLNFEVDDKKSDPSHNRILRMLFGTKYTTLDNVSDYYPMFSLEGIKNTKADVYESYDYPIADLYRLRSTYGKIVYLNADDIQYYTLTQKSSKDVKHSIKPIESKGEQIDLLRPVAFVYDDDPEEKEHIGLIYEETIDVMPEICTKDESRKAISYIELVPILLKEIQDLRARVKALEERQGG